jgi:hypothetical protein
MHRAGDEVVRVLGRATVVLQLERAAGGQSAHVADAGAGLVRAGLGFHLHTGIDVAQRGFAVAARIAVQFVVLLGMASLRNGLRRGQVGLRLLEVVVAQRDLARGHVFRPAPFEHMVGGAAVIRFAQGKGNLGGIGHRLVLADVVDDHQVVLAASDGREEVHALFFHQAADEVVVGFVVLHAIDTRVRRTRHIDVVVGKAAILEDLLDDVDAVHVLENAAAGGLRQKPQPGPQLHRVETITFMQANQLCLDAGTHEVAPGAAVLAGRARG